MYLRLIISAVIFNQFLVGGLVSGENLLQNDTLGFGYLPFPPTFEDISLMFELSDDCKNHLNLLSEDLNKGKEWALKLLDANAKPQAGLLFGNIVHVGNYDECLQVRGPKGIKGKYCSAMYDINEKYDGHFKEILENVFMGGTTKIEEVNNAPTRFKKSYGFCVPNSCTQKDLVLLFNYTEKKYEFPLHFHFDIPMELSWEFCDEGETRPLSTAAIIAVVIFSIFGIIIICSTVYEALYFKTSDEMKYNLCTSFSLLKNGKKLFTTSATSQDSLDCLNGLRVISMMWVVLGHGFMYQLYLPQINTAYLATWRTHTENIFFLGMASAVDTFFVISGLLVVYLYLKNKQKGVPFSIPKFYIHRILRLTPSLAMVVLLAGTLLTHLGSGPYWPIVYEAFQKSCEQHWWTTLIYLQNYLKADEQCLGHAWYLAVDTQMYFISPLILYGLVKWPKKTFGAILVYTVLICAYVFEISWKKHLGVAFFEQDEVYFESIYIVTHVRGTVYLLGMICGYFVFHFKYNKPLKLTKLKVLGLWVFSLLIMMGVLYWNMSLSKSSKNSILNTSFLNSLIRVMWTAGLLIIIILCISGYGGLINTFLSHKVFTVLIRLNYNIYLLHLLIMVSLLAQSRNPSYFSNLFALHKFWGDYAFTIGAAVIWTLAFESPIFALEKMFFEKRGKPVNTNGKVTNGHHTEIPIESHMEVSHTNR